MKPASKSLTGVGTSTPIPMNLNQDVVGVGFVAVVSGTVTYTINYCMDDPFGSTPWTNWFATTIAAATATANGNVLYPITGLQIVITAGTGTVTLTAIQYGV